ncbi:hypothetical protein [Nitratireductor sp. GCM10026969]|uniref:hypothetical protein n=1 Tax=Nitratireductor sp. GCM10026969 TaxID=3252645 RepID=UPI00360A2064
MKRNPRKSKRTTAHLNLKFTVRDVDWILAEARKDRGAEDIANRLTRSGTYATVAEVERICADAGVFVRRTG